MHHTDDKKCPLCESLKEGAHPEIKFWWDVIKDKFPDAHLSCTFRPKSMQELMFQQGKSRVHWPHSKHNHMKDGKPYARAMDIFQIGKDKVGRWYPAYFNEIAALLELMGAPIDHGGRWARFKDYPHFQLKEEVE